jgi:hypothetical protein
MSRRILSFYFCPHCDDLSRLENSTRKRYYELYPPAWYIDKPPAVTICKTCGGLYWLEDAKKSGTYRIIKSYFDDEPEISMKGGAIPADLKTKLQNAPAIGCMSLDEYCAVLSGGEPRSATSAAGSESPTESQGVGDRELYIRREIHWIIHQCSFDAYVEGLPEKNSLEQDARRGMKYVLDKRGVKEFHYDIQEQFESVYRQNIEALILLLQDKSDTDDRLLLAELYRQKKDFALSVEILDGIKEHHKITSLLKEQCEKKNECLFFNVPEPAAELADRENHIR